MNNKRTDMEYAEMFAKMLRVPTVSGCDQSLFDELHAVMREIAPDFHKLDLAKPRNNALVFKWEGKNHDRPMVIMGHQDVVPEGEAEKWTYPPYAGRIEDGVIYGRGAVDCKSTVFASMMAADELIAEGFTPEQDVYFCYGDDEEIFGGGATAEAKYLSSLGVTPALVIDEGGGMVKQSVAPAMLKSHVGLIGVAEKGSADFRFHAYSNGGHSSTPKRGQTPFDKLARFMNYIDTHDVFKRKVLPVVKEMLTEGSKCFKSSFMHWLVKRAYRIVPIVCRALPAIAGQVAAFFRTTMVFTMAQGAEVSNSIPDDAWVQANIRYLPGETKEMYVKKLTKIGKKFDVEVEVIDSREATPIASTQTPEYKHVCDTARKTYGEDMAIAPYLVCGATDCRYMQEICENALRFTPFLLSIKEIQLCHAYDERIPVVTLARGVTFFKNLIADYR